MMREQPLRTVKAHIYRTGYSKEWIPLGDGELLDVAFYHDIPRNIYRLLCLHNDKPIINCTMSRGMELIKTAYKFAQWLDSVTGVTYGVGFEDKDCLDKFECYFEEMRSKSCRAANQHNRDSSFEKMRYENDRLKVALAQSGNNVKVWERELACLRETNERLRNAIEESMVNVEKWNCQLRCLNEENNELKTKVMDCSIHKHNSCVNKKLKDVGSRISNAEYVLACRDKEIDRLKEMIEELAPVDDRKVVRMTERLNAAEILLVAKDKEMEKLKEKVSEVVPRLKEAEDLLVARNTEMETFHCKLKKYEELERTSKLYRGAETDNIRLKSQLENLKIGHNNHMGDCYGDLPTNRSRDMAIGVGQLPVIQSKEIRVLQETFNKKVKELFKINEDILKMVE